MTQFIITLPDGSTNTIVANEAFVEANYPGAWELVPEPETPLTQTSTRITRLAFRNRFTTAEKVALELAALDNPSATMPQRQQAAALRAHLKDLDAASWVDLTRPETVAALQMLEASELIGEGRAAAILDVDSITDIEHPQ